MFIVYLNQAPSAFGSSALGSSAFGSSAFGSSAGFGASLPAGLKAATVARNLA